MKFKRILCSALAAALAVSSYSISAFADDEKQMSVTVRIEGINRNLYYDTVEVPYTGDNLTVQNALMYVDEKNDDITISGVESGWITAVNDDMQATFGGWDGWLYTVNGVSPTDTVNNYNLSEGDSVVLYYGDPYVLVCSIQRLMLLKSARVFLHSQAKIQHMMQIITQA